MPIPKILYYFNQQALIIKYVDRPAADAKNGSMQAYLAA